MLAGIMWLVLFMVRALKYPANPPAVGDPETISYRQIIYLAFLAISGFSVLGLAIVYRRFVTMRAKKAFIPAVCAAVRALAFVAMPPNPHEIAAPIDLVVNFRIASAFHEHVLGLLGLILGAFWHRAQTARNGHGKGFIGRSTKPNAINQPISCTQQAFAPIVGCAQLECHDITDGCRDWHI